MGSRRVKVGDRVPPPREIERDLKRMVGVGKAVLEEYKWAWGITAGSGGGRGSRELVGIVHGGSGSDPTGSTAVSEEVARMERLMVEAARQVEAALSGMIAARQGLYRAVRANGELELGVAGSTGMVSRLELDDAKAAKLRRQARGEGWGMG